MLGLPGSSVGKISNYSIPGLGRSPGEGIGYPLPYSWAFLVAQMVKESTCNMEDLGSIPGLGRSPGEGKGYPLQYSGLENSMDCIVHGVTKSQTRLSDFHVHLQSYAQNSSSQASAAPELKTSRCTSWAQKRQRNQGSNCQHSLDPRESNGIPEKLLLLH